MKVKFKLWRPFCSYRNDYINYGDSMYRCDNSFFECDDYVADDECETINKYCQYYESVISWHSKKCRSVEIMPSARDSIYNGKDLLIINNKYLEIDGEIIKDEVEEDDQKRTKKSTSRIQKVFTNCTKRIKA